MKPKFTEVYLSGNLTAARWFAIAGPIGDAVGIDRHNLIVDGFNAAMSPSRSPLRIATNLDLDGLKNLLAACGDEITFLASGHDGKSVTGGTGAGLCGYDTDAKGVPTISANDLVMALEQQLTINDAIAQLRQAMPQHRQRFRLKSEFDERHRRPSADLAIEQARCDAALIPWQTTVKRDGTPSHGLVVDKLATLDGGTDVKVLWFGHHGYPQSIVRSTTLWLSDADRLPRSLIAYVEAATGRRLEAGCRVELKRAFDTEDGALPAGTRAHVTEIDFDETTGLVVNIVAANPNGKLCYLSLQESENFPEVMGTPVIHASEVDDLVAIASECIVALERPEYENDLPISDPVNIKHHVWKKAREMLGFPLIKGVGPGGYRNRT